MMYLQDQQLSAVQLAALKAEHEPASTSQMLLAELDLAFQNAEATIRTLDVNCLSDARSVGRKKLPTTVIGLLIHVAEHTQRHVGQAISAAKWATAL